MAVMIEISNRHRITANIGSEGSSGAELKGSIGAAEKHLHARTSNVSDIQITVSVEVSENCRGRNYAAKVGFYLSGKCSRAIAEHDVHEGGVRSFGAGSDQIEFPVLVDVQGVDTGGICAGWPRAAEGNLKRSVAVSADHVDAGAGGHCDVSMAIAIEISTDQRGGQRHFSGDAPRTECWGGDGKGNIQGPSIRIASTRAGAENCNGRGIGRADVGSRNGGR